MNNERLDKIRKRIVEIIEKENPETVEKIIEILKTEINIDSKLLIEQIHELNENGMITLEQASPDSVNIIRYATSINASWFWIIIVYLIITYLIIILVPNTSQLIYIRYIFSFIYTFYLPGFSITKILYSKKDINKILRMIISVGLSIGIVYLISLLLNVSIFGIKLLPLVTSLFIITLLASTLGLYMEHQALLLDTRAQNK